MRDSGLALDANWDNRTLYSLRHTYATLEMLRGEVDIHTLSKQMGNSAAMIERHYSKLTATMAADRLGCCRFQRHFVKVESETGEWLWEQDGNSAGSSSLRP